MGHAETTDLGLPIFSDNDRPTWRGDINGAMELLQMLLANRITKGEISVNPLDFGVKADGSDDSNALQATFNAGSVIYMPRNATIRVTKKVTIPDNRTVYMNGSKIVTTSPFGDFAVRVGSGTRIIGCLRVGVPGGPATRGVEINGAVGTIVDAIEVVSDAPAGNTNNFDCGITIVNSIRITVNQILVDRFDFSVAVRDSANIVIGNFVLNRFVRGLYLSNVKSSTFTNGNISIGSVNAAVSAGHNGVLIDATSDAATVDISLNNISVANSGEHAFRIGGAFTCKRVRFNDCSASLAGGCGFKVLGDAVKKHQEIEFIDCVVEDVAQDGTNGAGFMLQNVQRCKVNGAIVRKNTLPFSASEGFNIQGAEYVTVNDPDISDTKNFGYAVISNLGNSTGVRLNGGRFTISSGFCIHISYDNAQYRRVGVEGWPVLDVSNGAKCINIVGSGTGSIVGAAPMMTWQSVSTAADQISDTTVNATGFWCDVRAQFKAGQMLFRNGSRWLDSTSNTVKNVTNGAWV